MEFYQIYSDGTSYYKIPLHKDIRFYYYLEYNPKGNKWATIKSSVHNSFAYIIDEDCEIIGIDELPKFTYVPLFKQIFRGNE